MALVFFQIQLTPLLYERIIHVPYYRIILSYS